MASRSHVDGKVNSEVAERRLRPIYDCLDNGNNKKALQEADKVLKKQKDFLCAKVLKALALLRLGRHDDSSVILHEVHGQHPSDEATLQAMAICYREIHKYDVSLKFKPWKFLMGKCTSSLELIADMYENANKGRPGNEEILTALFMAYVRLGDYKKQQQTAMALHKQKPHKNPYYFWAVMSIVMQAHVSDKSLAQKMFLPLAERMTKKFVDDGKIEAEAEVQMYMIILEQLEKWEDALNLLDGPLADKLVSELNNKATKQAELYTKMKDWRRTNAAYKKLLSDNPDHIGWWKDYIASVVQLTSTETTEQNDTETSEEIDDTMQKGLAFIECCREKSSDGHKERGPYLAHLELIKQQQAHQGTPCRDCGNPLELLDNYYDMFGDKFCCFSDIKTYLEILEPAEQAQLAERLQNKNKFTNADGSLIYVENIKQMQRHITCLQLCLCLGCRTRASKEEKLALARELIDRHKNGSEFGKELLTTDLQFCDNYLLLAVSLLLDVWKKHGDNGVLWQTIVLLEMGIRTSPSNSQMKLLLIRLYCSVGAFSPCPALYDAMEIKHIMNDTLGYIVSSHVVRLGHFMAACAMYGTMLRFFTVNHKETAEYLMAAYKYGSFKKIHEFVMFRDRLQNSLQYASATAERMLLDMVLETNSHLSTEQIVMYMEIDPAKEKTNFDELQDNRDFSVIVTWDPPTVDMATVQNQSFQEEKAWLKIRNLTLRILAGGVMLGQEIDHDHQENNGITADGKQPVHLVLADLQSQLREHLDVCSKCYAQETEYPMNGPYRTRLYTYLRGNYQSIFLQMLDNVNYIHSLQDIDLEKIDSQKEEELKSKVPKMVEELIQQFPCVLLKDDNDRKSIDPYILEHTVLLAESVAFVCVLAGVCYKLLKPVKTVLARRNKKKKGNPIPIPCTFDNFTELVKGLEVVTTSLHKAISDLDPVFLSLDLSSLSLTQPFMEDPTYAEIEKEVWKKVEMSYQQSVVELTELLHKKLQYLSGLHL